MPDVKWVNEWYEKAEQVPGERYGPGLVSQAVPILTLDAIEAWLNNHRVSVLRVAQLHRTDENALTVEVINGALNSVFDDLLAQVQAMKEGRT